MRQFLPRVEQHSILSAIDIFHAKSLNGTGFKKNEGQRSIKMTLNQVYLVSSLNQESKR